MKEWFAHFARRTSIISGSPVAFSVAVVVILVWGITGPVFHFSDTWQLVINTGTTIVTFLMVFLIQNSQNRESKATQLKLDELLRAVEAASNGVIDIEDATEEELDRLHERFKRVRERLARAMDDAETDAPNGEDAANAAASRVEAALAPSRNGVGR